MPSAAAVFSTPAAIISLAAKIAVGRGSNAINIFAPSTPD
jgi:hypothetical protein